MTRRSHLANEPGTGLPTHTERHEAMLCHLLVFVGIIGVPFGNVVGPLIMWLARRKTSPFLDRHGRAILNFQFSVMLYSLVGVALIVIGVAITFSAIVEDNGSVANQPAIGVPIIVGVAYLIGLTVFDVILTVLGAIRAQSGRESSYPLAIPFL